VYIVYLDYCICFDHWLFGKLLGIVGVVLLLLHCVVIALRCLDIVVHYWIVLVLLLYFYCLFIVLLGQLWQLLLWTILDCIVDTFCSSFCVGLACWLVLLFSDVVGQLVFYCCLDCLCV